MELTAFTVFVVTAILVAVFRNIMKNWKEAGLLKSISRPSMPSLPLLGHAYLFRGSRDELFAKFSKLVLRKAIPAQIDMIQIRLGPFPMVFIISPVVAAEVLRSTNFLQKPYLYSFLHSWLGTGLLTGSGDKWRARRRLIEPAFHSKILQDFLTVMNGQAKKFVALQAHNAKSGKEFNIFEPVTLFSLDVICETAMGKRINAQLHQNMEYIKAIQSTNEVIQERQKSPWLWPEFLFKLSWTGKRYFENLEILHRFTRSVLADREADFCTTQDNKNKRLAFLDMLLKEQQNGNITTEGVEEEVDTFMFAGHDTTATAISWAIHMIGHHSEVQRKLHNEIDEIFHDDKLRDVTMEDIRKMVYLDLVIKECLRLFPSVPAFGRHINKECVLGGKKIPAGTECLIVPYIIHRYADFWPEPTKFDPDRFRPENSVGRHPFAFIPFSAGPRNCIGQRFALMEEKVILTHILRNYSIKSMERTKDLRLLGDIILRSKSGIRVCLKVRN